MITHIVLVCFQPDVTEAEVNEIWAALAAVREVVPGMTRASFGKDVSPEGLGRGNTHGFVMEFQSVAARDAYLEHPAHRAAGARLVAACKGGRDGVTVIDLA